MEGLKRDQVDCSRQSGHYDQICSTRTNNYPQVLNAKHAVSHEEVELHEAIDGISNSVTCSGYRSTGVRDVYVVRRRQPQLGCKIVDLRFCVSFLMHHRVGFFAGCYGIFAFDTQVRKPSGCGKLDTSRQSPSRHVIVNRPSSVPHSFLPTIKSTAI